jgi:hypothetical protein
MYVPQLTTAANQNTCCHCSRVCYKVRISDTSIKLHTGQCDKVKMDNRGQKKKRDMDGTEVRERYIYM